jgi:hypothetical protein
MKSEGQHRELAMAIDPRAERRKIVSASSREWHQLNAELRAHAKNDLVVVDWDVEYDQLGHDILIHAKVKVANKDDALLQVWLMDQHPGIWIPEYRPWVSSVVEFEVAENTKRAHVGLFDSKWHIEDTNAEYLALLWGYVQHNGAVEKFSFEKRFTYPG